MNTSSEHFHYIYDHKLIVNFSMQNLQPIKKCSYHELGLCLLCDRFASLYNLDKLAAA